MLHADVTHSGRAARCRCGRAVRVPGSSVAAVAPTDPVTQTLEPRHCVRVADLTGASVGAVAPDDRVSRTPTPDILRVAKEFLQFAFFYAVLTGGPFAFGILAYRDNGAAQVRRMEEAQRVLPYLDEHSGAVCRDGWVSTSVGSGTCSWHGGVRMWASDVRASAQLKPPDVNRGMRVALFTYIGLGFGLATAATWYLGDNRDRRDTGEGDAAA